MKKNSSASSWTARDVDDASRPDRRALRRRPRTREPTPPFPLHVPCLKHQDRPELGRSILFAGEMLPPHPTDDHRIEESRSSQASLVELRLDPRPQRAAKPIADGHPESHLRPL